jgi:hypothetical protein
MTEVSKPFLHTRADGFTETRDGDLAIVMRVRTKCDGVICWFQYRPNFNAEPIRIEWGAKDHVILLHKEVVPGLLRARYARVPLPSEIDAFLASFVPPAAEPEILPVVEAKAVTVVEPVAVAEVASLPLTIANEPVTEAAVIVTPEAPALAPIAAPAPAPAPVEAVSSEPVAAVVAAPELPPASLPEPPVAAPTSVVKTPPKKK